MRRPGVRYPSSGVPRVTPHCHRGPCSSTGSPASPISSAPPSPTSSPRRLSGADAARLLDAFAEIERLASAGTLLAARRVESSNVWRRTGHRSAAAHVAEVTGTGIGPAISTLETARHLGSLPATDEAVRQGRLSGTQVKEIAGAAILQPEAEQSLVDAAGQQPLNVLKLRCRRVRAAGQDQKAAYDAIRRGRYLRNWVEDNGAVRFDARLTPDEGARLIAAVAARDRAPGGDGPPGRDRRTPQGPRRRRPGGIGLRTVGADGPLGG